MGLFNRQPVIAVHDGKFHADDVFAVAALRLVLGGRGKIVRTRDAAVIAAADYVADVGGINDQEKNRFDHHMPEGAGEHANGIPYAAFGLVWKKYGTKISGSAEVASRIEERLVSSVDADDNGISLVTSTNTVLPYNLQSFLYTYRPTWKEDTSMYDESFEKLVEIAMGIIKREVVITRDALEAQSLVEAAYERAADKRIIELDGPYPYQEVLSAHPEPLYIVVARNGGAEWKVECVRAKPYGFENRKSMPASWAGLRDEELAKVSGVAGAIFCHRACFMAVTKTREGALALAKIAAEA
jgi:uncharacterized UPF0160 family protein